MAAKDKGDTFLSLSQAELKLIALGTKFSTGPGKVDYEQIAKHGGYTKGSAQVLYRKALRKLMDALDGACATNAEAGDGNGNLESTEAPTTPSAPKTPKTPRSRKGKRSKDGVEGQALDGNASAADAQAPGGDIMNPFGAPGDEVEPITPTKRQKKSPTKQPALASAPLTPKAEENSDPMLGMEMGESKPTIKME